jgi:hypothetical protein
VSQKPRDVSFASISPCDVDDQVLRCRRGGERWVVKHILA